jgi:hypothetical protein
MIQDDRGPVEAFLPGIVWRASQCGWLRIGKTAQGHDLWEKPDGRRLVIRAGVEPLVPVRPGPPPSGQAVGYVLGAGWSEK